VDATSEKQFVFEVNLDAIQPLNGNSRDAHSIDSIKYKIQSLLELNKEFITNIDNDKSSLSIDKHHLD